MNAIKQCFRLLKIYVVLLRFGLDDIILSPWFKTARILKLLNPWYLRYRWMKKGKRLRLALEKLGPIFIKFGQILSTRPDLLPEEYITELSFLRDKVPPFKSKKAIEIIEKAFGQNRAALFKTFDETALASASIAQVHAATLHDGSDVIVKILRPKIEKVIKSDVALLKTFAKLVECYWSEGKRLRPVEIVKEFESTLADELDLYREAANASQLRRNFDNSHLLYIPKIYWPFCKPNVMTMERIHGIPIDDLETLKTHNVNFKALSERGVEIFFTQVFRDNFFHADMHPGNIFVSSKTPENPQYIGVDFGIMGSLSDEDKRYLAENFLAFFNRDYRRVAQLHVKSNWVPKGTRVEQFEGAIRAVCEPIFEKPLKDISFGQLLVRLFQTARRFHMPVQPQLVLLQKTLLNVEGLGRQLNPDLDLWQTAKPFLEKWIKKEVGPRAFLRRMKEQAPFWIEKFPEIPVLVHDALIEAKNKKTTALSPKPKHHRFFMLGVSATFLFSAAYLFIFHAKHIVIAGSIFAGLAAIFLFFSILVDRG